jgi:hypothetical protein
MVVFASSRASWLLSLAVLGLACTGSREDPSPGGAPPPVNVGSPSGSGGGGGGVIGGGDQGGSTGETALFDDCSCAAIIESNTVALCNSCVDTAIASGQPCETQLTACSGDPECGLAQTLLANNDCGGDPACTAAAIVGILSDESAALLNSYYSCVCAPCGVCNATGAGGGGVGGGAPLGGGVPVADGSCEVGLK